MFAIWFDSDQIDIVSDDEVMPKEIKFLLNKYTGQFPFRLSYAINQHYPELKSGFYRNKRLEAKIHECFIGNNINIVIEDNYNPSGLTPVEMIGSLELSDDYLLVDSKMNLRGRLIFWELTGGKNPLYHDRLIMDFIIDDEDLLKALLISFNGLKTSMHKSPDT